MKSHIPFTFTWDSKVSHGDTFVAVIPKGVSGKAELLNILSQKLALPDYFGHNWDALEECLRDFSWIAARYIVLHHETLPAMLKKEDLIIYLDILRDCVVYWQQYEEHELVVSFPVDAKKEVVELLTAS